MYTCGYKRFVCMYICIYIYHVYICKYIVHTGAVHTNSLLCLISLLLKHILFGGTTATAPKGDALSLMSWTWLSDSGNKVTMKASAKLLSSSAPHQLIFCLTHILAFYLAFYVTSCTCKWGLAVPTDIWSSQLTRRRARGGGGQERRAGQL